MNNTVHVYRGTYEQYSIHTNVYPTNTECEVGLCIASECSDVRDVVGNFIDVYLELRTTLWCVT